MHYDILGMKVTAESAMKLEYLDLARRSISVEGFTNFFMSLAAVLKAATWQCLAYADMLQTVLVLFVFISDSFSRAGVFNLGYAKTS
jgi:hypothetical protein